MDRAEQLMIDFYASKDYDPKAARPADVVKAAIAFTIARVASAPLTINLMVDVGPILREIRSVLDRELPSAVAAFEATLASAPIGKCTGCGSTETIEQIRASVPTAISCCPERDMQSSAVPIEAGEEKWEGPPYEYGVTWGPTPSANSDNPLIEYFKIRVRARLPIPNGSEVARFNAIRQLLARNNEPALRTETLWAIVAFFK